MKQGYGALCALISISILTVGLLLAQHPVDVREENSRHFDDRNRIDLPDAGDDETDDEGVDDLANGFILATDKTNYDLCDTIEVTFSYRLDPPTAVTLGEAGGLGCSFLISLEDCAGNVVLDSEDLVGMIGCDDSYECSDEGVLTNTVEIPLCGIGTDIGCGALPGSGRDEVPPHRPGSGLSVWAGGGHSRCRV